MRKYTIEIKVGYHGDEPPFYYRRRIIASSEEKAYNDLLMNLKKYKIPGWKNVDGRREPIHSVKVTYAAPSDMDNMYLPIMNRHQELEREYLLSQKD